MRKLLFAVAVALLVWAAMVVPLPFTYLEPVPAIAVAEVLEAEDDTLGPLPEDLLLTAVVPRQPTTVGSIQVLFDDQRDLMFEQSVVPPGIDPERFTELQERLFRESVRVAVAMGLQAADRDVSVSGDGARVVATFPGTPAADVLQQEDVITGVDGREVSLASELATLLREREPGTEVELTIRRDDESLTRAIELAQLAQLEGTDQAGIGVAVVTANLEIDVPADVGVDTDVPIGGSSAGLMIALTVYDAAIDDDLTGDRVVSGTGTIDLSGNVGPVDGVPEKVRGALLADADVFLVPESLADVAREAAPDDLEVIAVASLQEAIDALTG